MRAYGFHFRRLAPWQRAGRLCRIAQANEEGGVSICGRPAVVEFEAVRSSGRHQTGVLLDYCEAHGAAVARLYGARIEASDERLRIEGSMRRT